MKTTANWVSALVWPLLAMSLVTTANAAPLSATIGQESLGQSVTEVLRPYSQLCDRNTSDLNGGQGWN